MDRVHRLGRDTIWLLQAASVLGRQFPLLLAQQVSELNGNATHLLPALEQDGLIFRVNSQRGDQPADYAFKHALVQDALYGSLLTPQRASLHQKAAEALEASYGEQASDVADVLAHHYVRTDRSDKAVLYLSLAAKKSLRVFSLAEAQAYLDQALAKIAKEPDCADDKLVASLVVDRLLVCCWEADFVGMAAIAQQYLPRLEAAGDSRELSRILSWLGEGYLNAVRFDDAERVLARARKIGEELGDEECIAYAMWDQMWLYLVTPDGRPPHALEAMAERVLSAAAELHDVYLETLTYLLLSFDPLQRGHVVQAKEWANKLVELGQRTGYPPAQSLGHVCAAWAAAFAEDHEEALAESAQAISASQPVISSRSWRKVRKASCSSAPDARSRAGALSSGFGAKSRRGGYLVQLTAVEIPYRYRHAARRRCAPGGVAHLKRALGLFADWRNTRRVGLGQPRAGGHLSATRHQFNELPPQASVLHAQQCGASFIRAKTGAKRLARRSSRGSGSGSLQEADTPGFLAQGLAALGVLCKATRQLPSSRKYFEEARQIALDSRCRESSCERIDAAL